MFTTVVLVSSFLGLLHSGLAQQDIILNGQCDYRVSGVANFNIANYLGTWYEVARYPQFMQNGQCNRAVFTAGTVANSLNVMNTQVLQQSLQAQAGTGQLVSVDGTGKLLMTYNVGGVIHTSDYYVLATDYISYALVYSCYNITTNTMQVNSWKLSRTTTLSAQANTAIANFLVTFPILQEYIFVPTSQSEAACFYIPQFITSQEVRFRGSCDNIVGQANFNFQRYVGLWHEINSYPRSTQSGTCISTRYQYEGNAVTAVNTQVFGRTGYIRRGPVEELASGRLRVVWSDGVNITAEDRIVIATDYDNYSLILTCVRVIGTEYVRVWATQQSKNVRSLSLASQQALGAAMSLHNYLVPSFFLPVSQTDDACFYYPEQNGQQVVLPGQCDQNIPQQPNFNMASYAGTWYHIERYTTNAQNAAVAVLNWEMLNGTLLTFEGQATITNSILAVVNATSSDNSLTLMRVLTTDYQSYSLVYTCENINAFERVVMAFKLSRGRTLSANAGVAIDAYMATRLELHQPLFVPVVQNANCRDPNSSFLVKSSLIIVCICYVINMMM